MRFDIRAHVIGENYEVKPRIIASRISGIQSAVQRATIGLLSLVDSDVLNPNRGIDYRSIRNDFDNFPALFSISLDNFNSFLNSVNDQHDKMAQINNIEFVNATINKDTMSVDTVLRLHVGDGVSANIVMPLQL